MSKLMTGVSGVRGVFADSLNPEIVLRYAARFGEYIKANSLNPSPKPKIVVGRDSRTTGPAMLSTVVSALLSVGCDVVEIGIVPTPTVLLNVKKHSAQGGIAITASHNPPEWNAMKFVDGDGMFLSAAKAAQFLASVNDPITWVDWQNVGTLTHDSAAISYHINKVLEIGYLDLGRIRSKRFRVVLDSVNGAGGLASPLLLERLGCEVIEINSAPTGVFAHPAEPLNQNLTQLEEAVRIHKADIGFATDPDVDRLSIVSELGSCIGEEYSVVLAELYVLPKNKGDIVVNLSTSMLSDHVAQRFGVKVHRAKVGEINVGKLMQEINSPIGGEGNGGIICPPVNYTRDALSGMALILGLLAESGKTVSQIVDELPRYYFAKDKLELEPAKMDTVMEAIPELLTGYELDRRDGIKAVSNDHWIHIRKSGTEPIIRIYVESPSETQSRDICSSLIKRILAI
ncbi:MAG: phosphoglucosamine mutase [Candidatus Cloacimonadota bacterium]|nr:phosphoglucosamine mutase [Candidatus Cloacimonadota bacterium]NMD12980.1 phosphoglucosamine mutase [Candidatus Cloacimonadota bacterium]